MNNIYCVECEKEIKENDWCYVSDTGDYMCLDCGIDLLFFCDSIYAYISTEEFDGDFILDDEISDLSIWEKYKNLT